MQFEKWTFRKEEAGVRHKIITETGAGKGELADNFEGGLPGILAIPISGELKQPVAKGRQKPGQQGTNQKQGTGDPGQIARGVPQARGEFPAAFVRGSSGKKSHEAEPRNER